MSLYQLNSRLRVHFSAPPPFFLTLIHCLSCRPLLLFVETTEILQNVTARQCPFIQLFNHLLVAY